MGSELSTLRKFDKNLLIMEVSKVGKPEDPACSYFAGLFFKN